MQVAADRAAVVGVRQLRAPGSRSSPSRASRETRTRRSPTPRRSTGSPASRRPSRSTSRGTRSTTTPTSPATPRASASPSGRSTRTSSRTTTTCSAASATRTPRVRRKALDHLLECVDIMDATGSRDLKLWFADGTNYPGQDDIRARQDRLAEALAAVYARLGPDQRMVLEYKLFEPSFYTMDVPDWGTAYVHCVALGPKGQGRRRHRPPRPGHQHRVHRRARCSAADSSAAFDFNSRFYADDDLMVGVGRSVPAVPDHARGREGGRDSAPKPAWRSCSTSATTSSPRSPARSGR